MRQAGLPLFCKRALDVGVALSGMVVCAPLMLGVAAAVRACIGRPVLFRQRRPGYKGRIIEVLKFRTMTDERNDRGELLPDAVRLRPLGAFLRRTSLDELPQLWNVLRGDLSLVGPRPLLIQYLDRYTPEQARRHDVLPGITGWAQINGRNALTWEEKFSLDVWYVDHWSLLLDLKILAKTVGALFRTRDTSHGDFATMPEFLGYSGNVEPAPEYRTVTADPRAVA